MPKSEIVGVDPSEGFIAFAQKNVISNRARYERGDAQALSFKDGSFDNTLSLLVMNFIPDPARAIAEMRRVTKPGGIVSACVWDYDSGMQMLRFFWDEAVALSCNRTQRRAPYEAFARGTVGGALDKSRP